MELQVKRVAILAENNYQELELWYPLCACAKPVKVTVVACRACRSTRVSTVTGETGRCCRCSHGKDLTL